MAARKPLVIINGQVQNLPAGDSLDAPVSEVDLITATNNNAGSIVIGAPVYVAAAGAVDLAQANASGTKKVLGLVYDTSITAAATGNILTDGVLTATTTQWDAVAGTTGGLAAGTQYYLDPATAGMLTATAPSTSSQFVCPVGVALSTTEMEITIGLVVGL